MNQADRQTALESVEEMIALYRANASSLRSQATARRVGRPGDQTAQELESQAREYDAVVEKLAHVQRVVLDSMKRRRFSHKRRQVP